MNKNIQRNTTVIDLGLIDYQKAWDYQTALFNQVLAIKTQNRNLSEDAQVATPNFLVVCEHPSVFTLGKSGNPKNLLLDDAGLQKIGSSFYEINRGGDITFHGPGQLVVYPVIDLENFFTDIHQYMRLLEESVIQTLIEFGLSPKRIPGMTGVWLEEEGSSARKICAMGVKTGRWVTMHGLALNVNTDLSFFKHIIPCGIEDKEVTSLQRETGAQHDFNSVKSKLVRKIVSLFDMTLVN